MYPNSEVDPDIPEVDPDVPGRHVPEGDPDGARWPTVN